MDHVLATRTHICISCQPQHDGSELTCNLPLRPAGQTQSEGGFAPNRVSAASLLDVFESTDKKGKKYYKYEFLVRTADGDEGGRHQLISAAVSNGKLLILKIQAGDKRWIYGVDREAKESWNSFTVA
jgi:hypothetical protein